jgi:hypothetical protein
MRPRDVETVGGARSVEACAAAYKPYEAVDSELDARRGEGRALSFHSTHVLDWVGPADHTFDARVNSTGHTCWFSSYRQTMSRFDPLSNHASRRGTPTFNRSRTGAPAELSSSNSDRFAGASGV